MAQLMSDQAQTEDEARFLAMRRQVEQFGFCAFKFGFKRGFLLGALVGVLGAAVGFWLAIGH